MVYSQLLSPAPTLGIMPYQIKVLVGFWGKQFIHIAPNHLLHNFQFIPFRIIFHGLWSKGYPQLEHTKRKIPSSRAAAFISCRSRCCLNRRRSCSCRVAAYITTQFWRSMEDSQGDMILSEPSGNEGYQK